MENAYLRIFVESFHSQARCRYSYNAISILFYNKSNTKFADKLLPKVINFGKFVIRSRIRLKVRVHGSDSLDNPLKYS